MANTSRVNGFRPVAHLTGAPYNGQATLYAVNASDGTALFPGDAVKFATGANSDGINYVTALAAGTAGTGQAAVGVVVGVIPAKIDPVTGKMTAGAISSLDTPVYRAASTAAYILVADSPDVLFEVEATTAGASGSLAVADIGKNINLFAGAGSTTTGTSAHSVDLADKGTAATLPFKIHSVGRRIDNEPGGNATKVLVYINNHQLKGGTGTAGV